MHAFSAGVERTNRTRRADHTWQTVLEHTGSDKMTLIFPEGRMERADGLDKQS